MKIIYIMIQEVYTLHVISDNSEKFIKPIAQLYGDNGKETILTMFHSLSKKEPRKHYRVYRECILTDIIRDNKQPEEETKFML